VPTVPNLLGNAARVFADRQFLIDDDRTLTYAQADDESAVLARGLLALGHGKAARIAMLVPNCIDFVLAWLAGSRIGALMQPLSTLYKPAEIDHALGHLDTETLVVLARYNDLDLVERIEQAIPGLKDQAAPALQLASHPYLRRIIVPGGCDRPWALGGFDALRELAGANPAIDAAYLRAVEERVVPADLAVTISTSGTTAHPKAVVHTHGTMVRICHEFLDYNNLHPDERNLCSMPLFWVGGFNTSLVPVMHAGAALVFARGPKVSDFIDAIERHRATRVPGWMPQRRQIVRDAAAAGRDISSIRGSLLHYTDEFGREIPEELAAGSFGMTETFGMHTIENRSLAMPRSKAGTLGRNLPHVQRRIVDLETGQELAPGGRGELLVRGYTLMNGYYKVEREDAFDADGYFATGDVCSIDEDGFLTFHTRRTEMIKTSGANVAPLEVERVLKEHPEVDEAYVFGIPHAQRGEAVIAVFTNAQGKSVAPGELRRHAAERLSAYKVPLAYVQFAGPDIPRTGSAKVSKIALADIVLRDSDLFDKA